MGFFKRMDKKLRIIYIIGTVLLICGMVMIIIDVRSMSKKSSAGNGQSSDANSTYDRFAPVNSISSSANTSPESESSGNVAVAGVVVSAVSIVMNTATAFISGKKKDLETPAASGIVAQSVSGQAQTSSLEQKLRELIRLKDLNLITEDEFSQLRKDVLKTILN